MAFSGRSLVIPFIKYGIILDLSGSLREHEENDQKPEMCQVKSQLYGKSENFLPRGISFSAHSLQSLTLKSISVAVMMSSGPNPDSAVGREMR